MKKLTLICALLFAGSNLVHAQWVKIFDTEGEKPIAIECLNADIIIVAGYHNSILKSTDYGSSWKKIKTNFEIYANGMVFADKRTGYILGNYGRIAKTTNTGNDWELITADTNYKLIKACFLNQDTGWIIGNHEDQGLILKTSDGGQNWESKYVEYELNDIQMLNETSGLISIGSSMINYDYGFLKMENGGNSWALSNPEFDFADNISFISNNVGYCIAQTASHIGIFRTSTAGENWNPLNCPNAGISSYNTLLFLNDRSGFCSNEDPLSGSSGTYRTDNKGVDWNKQTGLFFLDICMLNSDTGFAIHYNGSIYSTINGGQLVGTPPQPYQTEKIKLHPNPLVNKTILRIDESLLIKYWQINFTLYNQNGDCIKNIHNISSTQTEIYREGLKCGLYFYSVTTNEHIIKTGKLLVK